MSCTSSPCDHLFRERAPGRREQQRRPAAAGRWLKRSVLPRRLAKGRQDSGRRLWPPRPPDRARERTVTTAEGLMATVRVRRVRGPQRPGSLGIAFVRCAIGPVNDERRGDDAPADPFVRMHVSHWQACLDPSGGRRRWRHSRLPGGALLHVPPGVAPLREQQVLHVGEPHRRPALYAPVQAP